MRVTVRFFGRLRELVGSECDRVELPEGARLSDLFGQYAQRYRALAELQAAVAPAVNLELADWDRALQPGDEVAFLPPVSGGDGVAAATPALVCMLVEEPIEPGAWLAPLVSPEQGAVVIFEGVVRNHRRDGQPVGAVEYEAYREMAQRAMQRLAEVVRKKFAAGRVLFVHRLGRVPAGEISLLIAVSTEHRAAAFDACRFALEAFKHTIPIWKRELTATGAVWVEGERLRSLEG